MPGLFSALIDYMEEEQFRYEILEGQTIVRFSFKGGPGWLLCFGEVDERRYWMTFYSYLPVTAPEEKLTAISEFVTRANRGLRIGNFELDFDDGEIRFKTSIDVEGGELAPKMIDNLLRANLSTMNRYFAGFMQVIFGDASVADTIRRIETPPGLLEALEEEEEDEETFFAPDDDDDDEFGGRF